MTSEAPTGSGRWSSRRTSRSGTPSGRRRPSACSRSRSPPGSSGSTCSATASSRCTRAHYLLSPYYEHWAHTAEHYGVKAGKLDPEEIEKRTRYYLEHPDEPLADTKNPDFVAFADAAVKGGVSPRRESDAKPRFAVGDRVRVKDDSPHGHTRRARYVRGKTGVIELAHGTFLYPDSAGNGGPDNPTHVYTVRFDGTELWGDEHAEPNTVVYFDVWEPYIEPGAETKGATR